MTSIEKNYQQRTKVNSRKNFEKLKKWLLVLLSASAIAWGASSCDKPTWVDIAKDKEKIEISITQRKLAIDERKSLVIQFNQYIDMENSNPSLKDDIAFQKGKAQVYDRICELNEEIDKDTKRIWKKEKNLYKDERKSLKKHPNIHKKMDPNAYNWAIK